MSSRHLSMKAVEFEPSLSAIAFGTCFFRSPNATLETLEMSSISLQEKREQLDNVKLSLPRDINQTLMNVSLTFDDVRETINESQVRRH